MRGLTLHTRFRRRIAGMRTRRALPRPRQAACSTAAGAAVAAHGMEAVWTRQSRRRKKSSRLSSPLTARCPSGWSGQSRFFQTSGRPSRMCARRRTMCRQPSARKRRRSRQWNNSKRRNLPGSSRRRRLQTRTLRSSAGGRQTTRRACWRTIWQPLCACRMKSRS